MYAVKLLECVRQEAGLPLERTKFPAIGGRSASSSVSHSPSPSVSASSSRSGSPVVVRSAPPLAPRTPSGASSRVSTSPAHAPQASVGLTEAELDAKLEAKFEQMMQRMALMMGGGGNVPMDGSSSV